MPHVHPLQFPCRLPPDARGIPCGRNYPRFLRAGRDNTYGTATNIPAKNLQPGRVLDALSTLEQHAIYSKLIDPSVLDVREQYPMYDPERIRKYLDDPSKRIPRSLVPSLDIVVTRQSSSSSTGYTFEAICVKEFEELGKEEIQRRLIREQEFCASLNWSWTLFTRREVDEQQTKSARSVCMMARDADLMGLKDYALKIAPLILQKAGKVSLRRLKTLVAKAVEPDQLRADELIAAAILFGFVKLDLDAPFDNDSPIHLTAEA